MAEAQSSQEARSPGPVLWLTRLRLTAFRNYAELVLDIEPRSVVLTGPNGAGKTNLLEAVSLLAPGPGLRRAGYGELVRAGGIAADGPAGWAVSAVLRHGEERIAIGTGARAQGEEAGGRLVRIDGVSRSPAALAEHVEVVWLTPAMDGLFTGPASDRRRFLDRMIVCFDPAHRTRLGHLERAVRQRNRLLEGPRATRTELEGLEVQIAETGVAIAAARREAVQRLQATIAARLAAAPASPFPAAELAVAGRLEDMLAAAPAVEVEESYLRLLAGSRERDRLAGRLLEGPHLSDLVVGHAAKAMPARSCSTGEQKSLLLNLVLGHAALVARSRGRPPLLLLDEVAAHLDAARRRALFAEVVALGSQAWLTGTDPEPFFPLESMAQYLSVHDGCVSH